MYAGSISDWREGRDAWREVSAETAWNALCVLPPIYVPGGFLVSEPYSDDAEGRTFYFGFTEAAGRHFTRLLGRHNAASEIARLRALLSPA